VTAPKLLAAPCALLAGGVHVSLKEYRPGTTFTGVIERTPERSQPAWPAPLRAREGGPNVLFLVLDDTGFGQLGCYGSPIRTPNIDRLAAHGLRFSNMHTTALCSPTRSCLLTGRNHHSNAMAGITEGSTGYPGYNGNIPFENGFLSELLQLHWYNTYAVGKWHLTPAEQVTAAGPHDRWPLGRGFERYYGFLGGDTHQYYPDLVHDNHQVLPPRTPEEGYHLTVDLVDHAIQFIADAKQVAPDKPFFLYFAPGAMHAPHHVPKEWADRYAGQFDDGWDAYRTKVFQRQQDLGLIAKDAQLSRHDPDVQDWEKLPPDEKRLYARMMEVFAGYLEHTDDQIGRLLRFLEEAGQLDNTILMLISDNGASAEGGPHGSLNENMFFNNVDETVADNLKAIDELGGPKHFNHEKLRELDRDGWELYHVAEDPAETRNRAQEERGRLLELIALWYVEAGKYDVLPIDTRGTPRFAEERPQLTTGLTRYVYRPGTEAVTENAAPKVLNRPHSITARVEIQDGADGVILAQGGRSGGYSLFVQDHKLHYVQNYVGARELHVESRSELPQGEHEVRFEFVPTGKPDIAHGKGAPGKGQLYVDGQLVGEERFPITIPIAIGITEGLTCGRDELSPVTDRYRPPFAFRGGLKEVVVEVGGQLIQDSDAEKRMVMARQ
jgi:arylsulfatase A-like enzyme